MLVFSKKERSWQSSYAIRKVASHPSPFLGFRRQTCTAAQMGKPTCHPLLTSWFYLNPFQPWPTSAVSGSGSAATTALCSIGLMPMMALPQTENYARGFQVQMYFPHCQFAATERKTSLFCKKYNTPAETARVRAVLSISLYLVPIGFR